MGGVFMEKATFTVAELAKYLNIGKAGAYKLIKSGEIRSLKIGRQFRIPIICVDEWMKGQK